MAGTRPTLFWEFLYPAIAIAAGKRWAPFKNVPRKECLCISHFSRQGVSPKWFIVWLCGPTFYFQGLIPSLSIAVNTENVLLVQCTFLWHWFSVGFPLTLLYLCLTYIDVWVHLYWPWHISVLLSLTGCSVTQSVSELFYFVPVWRKKKIFSPLSTKDPKIKCLWWRKAVFFPFWFSFEPNRLIENMNSEAFSLRARSRSAQTKQKRETWLKPIKGTDVWQLVLDRRDHGRSQQRIHRTRLWRTVWWCSHVITQQKGLSMRSSSSLLGSYVREFLKKYGEVLINGFQMHV